MSDKITIKINDKEIAVRPGTKLLAAIREAGERVPTLCQHKDLTPGGKCRLRGDRQRHHTNGYCL
jgi:NADH dehydrogenase/NADH:ubiquinone oxidoreductase subunit G